MVELEQQAELTKFSNHSICKQGDVVAAQDMANTLGLSDVSLQVGCVWRLDKSRQAYAELLLAIKEAESKPAEWIKLVSKVTAFMSVLHDFKAASDGIVKKAREAGWECDLRLSDTLKGSDVAKQKVKDLLIAGLNDRLEAAHGSLQKLIPTGWREKVIQGDDVEYIKNVLLTPGLPTDVADEWGRTQAVHSNIKDTLGVKFKRE